jgi:effector-binding domain-containing protein
MKTLARFLVPLFFLFQFGCNNSHVEDEPVSDLKKITNESEFANSLKGIPLNAGVVGIYKMPEMLCITIMDSTRASTAAEAVERSYVQLGQELQYTGAIQNGPYGQISYSNDTANFKYECFALISKVPAVSPKKAKVVVLEATRVLAFNYYGPYQQLHTAYAQVKDHMSRHKLVQWGPMREYYVTDPRSQPNPKRWRTLLLVPVQKATGPSR